MDTRNLLMGIAAGSALTFMLDPKAGGRRRALVRDQAMRATRKTRDGLDATARDVANRAVGVASSLRGRWVDERISDDLLVQRVRAKLGRVCSHPHAIEVESRDGDVRLRGPVLASEADRILSTAAAVRGVCAVHNELDEHDTSEGIPALQGGGQIAGSSLDILQPNWAPATRAIVGFSLLITGVWIAVIAKRGWSSSEARYAA